MRRGDLVTIALQGDYGKPRPALIIQSDLFSEHPSVTVLPVTGELRAAPLFRIQIEPNETNGLQKPSDVMVDKAQSIPRERIGGVFGHVSEEEMLAVSRSLAVFLGVI
ncbi:MAG TPA: growth inhibitor PemK [Polaromonas sp.]|uniref:type II toxin-antitoxin system PemK/MazF family toxin n=1 Tax=Polaromonas sp. UBA4122 TaxID=1947074 RepID=UPI000EC30830|nr:type II toxin-antitoxin system PemK/MazF family toxin [Polaromonas sp. UBA4122]HAL37428.1 growth inhibitor PemK [Polaromonas sp.]